MCCAGVQGEEFYVLSITLLAAREEGERVDVGVGSSMIAPRASGIGLSGYHLSSLDKDM